MGGEDRSPGRQLPNLAEGRAGALRQRSLNLWRESWGHGRKVHDRRRHHAAARDDVCAKDGQVVAGIGEVDTMENLEPRPEASRFQVELSQSPAAVQLVADEQLFPIQAAADGLQGGIKSQGLQIGQLLAQLPNPTGQGIDQGVDTEGHLAHQQDPAASRMAILPCADESNPRMLRPIAAGPG